MSTDTSLPKWAADVLAFWFDELDKTDWFRKSDALDESIRTRFGAVHEMCAAEGVPASLGSARHALARVIVLDQFPRNMFRNSARAFATDPTALGIAQRMVADGLDRQLETSERHFAYLPFEHSEDPAMQIRSVALIASLGDPELTRYAEAHKVIIDRFGRYPHRNAALQRASTPEELAFLAEPNSSF